MVARLVYHRKCCQTEKDIESIYSVSAGSVNTEAKFGKTLSRTTYPIEISEIGTVESYGRNENLVEIIKSAVDGLVTRRGRDINNNNRYDAPFPSCSPFILNGNLFISRKGEIIKRLHVAKFSEEDRHDRDPRSKFNTFQAEKGHKIKVLGDWTIRYILDNKVELLLSGKYTTYEISKKAISEFYRFADREVPEWLTRWITDLTLEELDVDDESIIRSILFENVNRTLERNSKLVDLGNKVIKEYEGRVYSTGEIRDTTLGERIDVCIDNDLWPWLRRKAARLGETLQQQEYYIDASILELYLKRLPELDIKKLGQKTGFKYTQRRSGMRVLKCTKEQLKEFIRGTELLPDEDV